jgi:hypothetical protein
MAWLKEGPFSVVIVFKARAITLEAISVLDIINAA